MHVASDHPCSDHAWSSKVFAHGDVKGHYTLEACPLRAMRAGLIRGLSSLDDGRGFKEKFFDGQMEQPAESQEAQVQLGLSHLCRIGCRSALHACACVVCNIKNMTSSCASIDVGVF